MRECHQAFRERVRSELVCATLDPLILRRKFLSIFHTRTHSMYIINFLPPSEISLTRLFYDLGDRAAV